MLPADHPPSTTDSPPWSILVIPTKDDPGKLLATREGRGPVPVVVWRLVHDRVDDDGRRLASVDLRGEWAFPGEYLGDIDFREGAPIHSWRHVHALPLRWGAELVPEGWDRARRVWWNWSGFHPPEKAIRQIGDAMCDLFDPGVLDILALARALELCGLVEKIVLLEREGDRLVERMTSSSSGGK